MSTHWLNHVWKLSPYKGATRLVHLSLADQAHDDGVTWPHLPLICARANISRASAFAALRQMQSDGLLRYDGEEISKPSKEIPLILLPVQDLDGQSRDWTEAVQNLDARPDHSTLIEPSVEPPSNQARAVTPVTTEFEFFWINYPKKVGKGAARAAFSKAIVKTDVETIQKAALAYSRERIGKDKRYTLNPATWLNQEHWEDEEAPSRIGILPDAPMPEWMKRIVKEEQ